MTNTMPPTTALSDLKRGDRFTINNDSRVRIYLCHDRNEYTGEVRIYWALDTHPGQVLKSLIEVSETAFYKVG